MESTTYYANFLGGRWSSCELYLNVGHELSGLAHQILNLVCSLDSMPKVSTSAIAKSTLRHLAKGRPSSVGSGAGQGQPALTKSGKLVWLYCPDHFPASVPQSHAGRDMTLNGICASSFHNYSALHFTLYTAHALGRM